MAIATGSVLLLTLDSCRYNTFVEADAPNLKAIGPLHLAMAPGNFSYSSHAAIFMGFTPGVAGRNEPLINPKFGKIFRVAGAGSAGKALPGFALEGRNVVDGFKRKGYLAIGSGAVTWFNPETETGRVLSQDFDAFYYPGTTWDAPGQVSWLMERVGRAPGPVFAFLNVGETHVPYYHEAASWDRSHNPCTPFSDRNDAGECRRRQRACLEFLDRTLAPLLDMFRDATVVACADHGDCWGEDGLWEHGIHHANVMAVPLLIRMAGGEGSPP